MRQTTSPELQRKADEVIATMLLLGGAAVLGFLAWRRRSREKWYHRQGIVDEVGDQSFPASDAPPWSGAHS